MIINTKYQKSTKRRQASNDIKGYVHAIESLGAVDGPGLRTVIFLEGCPLRCSFCHNVDCTIRNPSHTYSVAQTLDVVLKQKPYWHTYQNGVVTQRGGVTLSGGEPTNQPEYILALLKELKKNQVHTAIDSCLLTSSAILDSLIPYVDMWMVSLKHMDPIKHTELTKVGNVTILKNIKYLSQVLCHHPNRQLIIRFLVIPGITNTIENLEATAQFIAQLQKPASVEVLPYGAHGAFKWQELYGTYPLASVPDATSSDVEEACATFTKYGIPILR